MLRRVGNLAVRAALASAEQVAGQASTSYGAQGAAMAALEAPCTSHVRRMLVPGLRRAFASEPKSMLGGGANMAPSMHILEEAAEARMQKIKSQASQHSPAPARGVVSRIFGVISDAIGLSLLASLGFAGYYTYAYEDVSELEDQLKKARVSLGLPETPVAPPPPGIPPPLPATALEAAPGTAPSSSASSSTPAVEPSAFPPLTKLWAMAMTQYIGTRKAISKQVCVIVQVLCPSLLACEAWDHPGHKQWGMQRTPVQGYQQGWCCLAASPAHPIAFIRLQPFDFTCHCVAHDASLPSACD